MSSATTVLHLIDLTNVGGVEVLFKTLVTGTRGRPDLRHHVLTGAKSVHPSFRGVLRSCSVGVSKTRSWHGLRVPRAARPANFERLAKAFEGAVVLVWNRRPAKAELAALRAAASFLAYCEQGSSWVWPADDDSTRDFLDRFDLIVTCSHAARRLIELRWNPRPPLVEVRNPSSLDPLAEPQKPRRLPTGRPFRLGVACRLIERKGVNLAVAALARVLAAGADAELWIAGVGPAERDLRALAARQRVSERVRFAGLVDDMSGFFNEIDCLLMPSIFEPIGIVPMEAASTGCPTIASRIDGAPESVLHDVTGLTLEPECGVRELAEHGISPEYLARSEAGGLGDDHLPAYVYLPRTDRLSKPLFVHPDRWAEAVLELLDQGERYEKLSAGAYRAAATDFAPKHWVEQFSGRLLERAAARS